MPFTRIDCADLCLSVFVIGLLWNLFRYISFLHFGKCPFFCIFLLRYTLDLFFPLNLQFESIFLLILCVCVCVFDYLIPCGLSHSVSFSMCLSRALPAFTDWLILYTYREIYYTLASISASSYLGSSPIDGITMHCGQLSSLAIYPQLCMRLEYY